MSKYIIKNCPCLYGFIDETLYCIKEDEVPIYKTECNSISDCLLKQIVEKCKEAIKTYENEEFYEDDCDRFLGECSMARDILDLLDIQEEGKC